MSNHPFPGPDHNPSSFLRFQGNEEPTLGVELELQLVDKSSFALKSAILDIMEQVGPDQDWLKPELMQSYVELNTGVCHTVPEVEQDLARKLHRLYEVADKAGARVLWAGSHPFST